MRFVFGLVLILGLGLAGSAVYLVRKQISQNEQALLDAQTQLQNQVTTADIYVAAVPLKYGHVLVPDDVRLIKFPASSLPEGVFQDEASLFPNGNAEKRTVLRAIEANEPILAVKVTEPGQEAGITTMLSAGMRAFTIQVDAQSGVSGFVHPGDRVDILWTGRIREREYTLRLDTNVRVIAVDQSVDQDNRDTQIARTVTVEGTAQQVANFQQAQAAGRLTLALLGVGDTTATEVENVDINSVFGIDEPAPIEAPEAPEECFVLQRVPGSEPIKIPVDCSDQ